MLRSLILIAATLLLTGCIARTAVDVVTAPVRAGAQVADWATTSQDEADRARGRQPFHAWRFAGQRHDCGDKAGYIQANLAFALQRADMGPAVRAFAIDLLRD